MEDSDHELIGATGRGDHLAFERLVTRYQGPILNFIFRIVGERGTAEDLAQEVFLRVYRAAPHYEPIGKARTWIYTIAYNLCLNELKRLKRYKRLREEWRLREETFGGCAQGDAAKRIESEAVLHALRELPDNQRAALLLRATDGLSYAEIGEVLSVSVSSVESLVFRARKHLRQVLREKGKE